MKEKDRNGKSDLRDFLRYKGGEMTYRERNTFERELQKDPFAEESAEGFSEIPDNALKADMKRLSARIKTRIAPGHRFVYYRIAASIAILMIISSIYFIVQKQGQTKEVGEVTVSQAPLEITESKAITLQETRARKDESAAQKGRSAIKSEAPVKQPPEEEPIPEKRVLATETVTGQMVTDLKDKIEPVTMEDIAAAPVAAVNRQEQQVTDEIKKQEAMVQDDISLNEVVVVGYGMAKRSKAAGAEAAKADTGESVNTPPEPAEGKSSFDKYIEENMRKPSILAEGDRAVVVMTLIVRSTGAIDSINVIRSPGDEFSKEAKRLIMEGPSWKPATSNGEKIDNEIRIRIVFK